MTDTCKFRFKKWAGRKIGPKYQGERVGGAILETSCGQETYGAEFALGNCPYCGKPVELVGVEYSDLIIKGN